MTSLCELATIACSAWAVWNSTHDAATTALSAAGVLFALVTVGGYVEHSTKWIVKDLLGADEVERRWRLRASSD